MEADNTSRKIMVVDDNDDGRRLVGKVLKMHRYQVIGVATGEDAITKAQSELPDLILMDIRLPGAIDGLEATRRIKAEPETAKITILALTASVRPEDVQAALDAGCSGFARKPIDIDELPKQVDEYIKRTPKTG